MSAHPSTRIGFRRHLTAVTVPEEAAVYLVSARGTIALSGERAVALGPLLDGSLSMAELQQRTAGRLTSQELGATLVSLAKADLIGLRRSSAPDTDPAAGAYWDLTTGDADQAAERLAAGSVRVLSLSATGAEEAAVALRAAGLSVPEGPDLGPALTMVLCDDYLDPRLESINAAMLAAGLPWLLAKTTGADLWVGPVFHGQGPCWGCLAGRLRMRRTGETLARGRAQGVTAPEASLAVTRLIGLQLAVLEAIKFSAGAGTDSWNTVSTFDTVTLQSRRHPVARRPQCVACGDPEFMTAQVSQPVQLVARPKASLVGNGHRALTADQVWERYRHLADPITGITDPIRRDPRCPDFLHSYLSGANRAVTGHGTLTAARAGLRQQSGGKGSTDIEARVGALCEAVERWCGSRCGDEPVVRASLRDLGDRAVHPDQVQLFDPRQFRDRERWNAANGAFQYVPEIFDETDVLDWTPVWSLTRDRARMLPTDLLYFSPQGHRSLRATSNGNAAGASREDAIMQGLLELVERDAVALWWYNRTRQPEVDLASFADQWMNALPARYARVNRELWLLDLTADLGVPVMAAVSRRTDKPAEDLMLGFGAHPDPTVAARRALTELGQLLPAVVEVDAAGAYGAEDPHVVRWWRSATVANQPYLRPAPGLTLRREDYRYAESTDLRDDVEGLVARAAAEGLEVLVLDQTRPDVGLPVVKVIVPGLRHFWARFAPGRLFDVPVRLGRVAAPTPYPELNPIPMFL
ncbi:TOMM precursor leader peptide-binding protein [Micromonospora sp. NPDC048871]|uniref:TOMM precursor leader peptide-binding protein n=1 Tax=Micromonospora sp. NPDC048871 TaxID=3364259 RepID=UPI003720F796